MQVTTLKLKSDIHKEENVFKETSSLELVEELTARELEILSHISQGLSSRDIAGKKRKLAKTPQYNDGGEYYHILHEMDDPG